MRITPSAPARFQGTSLVEMDPELLSGLTEELSAAARRETQVPMLEVPAGPWDPKLALGAGAGRVFGLVVVDGLIVRELRLGASTAIELLGPGDLTTVSEPDDRLLPVGVRWTAASAAKIALLDGHLLEVIQRHPVIAARLVRRAAAQADRLEVTRAISQLPRIDQRLLALFWHLAERWGRVGPAGVIVPLSLTHVTLGQLVGARRPTVSLALKELAAAGTIVKRDDGSWLLAPGSAEVLRATTTQAATAGRQVDLIAEPEPEPALRPVTRPAATPARREVEPALPGGEDLEVLAARVRALRRQCEAQRLRVSATLDRARTTRQRTVELRAAIRSARETPERP